MMVTPFDRLFSLPAEMVLSTVLTMLVLKDISNLERAVNNKHSQVVFRIWMKCFSLSVTLSSTTNPQFLKWIAERKIKMKFMKLVEGADTDCLGILAGNNLEVTEFHQDMCDNISVESRSTFLQGLSGLRRIDLWTDSRAGDSASWNKVLAVHPELRSFSMMNFDNDFMEYPQLIAALANNCKQLITVYLNSGTVVDDSSVVLLAQQCNHLEELSLEAARELTDCSLQALGQHCVGLRVLRLRTASRGHASDSGVIYLLQRCRKLTTLNLWDCTCVTARSFAALVPLCGQITDLSLRNCIAFNSREASLAMKQLHLLTNLSLPLCTNISEALLIAVINNNVQLTIVDLSGVSTVTDNVLSAFAQSCVNMVWLAINGCPNVTNLALLAGCTKLFKLDVADCAGVSDDALLQLAATPGRRLLVGANGNANGITEETFIQLESSQRILLKLF